MAAVVVAIVTATVLGIPLALALDRHVRGPELVGLGFLYGCGLVYAAAFVLALSGVSWSAANITAVALAVSAACFFFVQRRGFVRSGASAGTKLHLIDLLTLFTLAAFTLYATVASVWDWDFWAIWGLKGRVFFEAQTIDWRFLQSRWNDFCHPDYPLLLPLNYSWIALLGGGWSDRWLGLLCAVFAASLVLIVRGLAARETSPAAAATIAFASTAFAASGFVGTAEGVLIAYSGAALLYLRREEPEAMRHGALLLGFAACSKNEGLALVVVAAVAMLLTGGRRRALGLWPAFAIAAPWTIARAVFHLQTDLARGAFLSRVAGRLDEIPQIAMLLARSLSDRWIWLAMLVGALVAYRSLAGRERFVLLTVAAQLAIYIAVYFGTPYSVEWHIGTSWPRLTRHVATPLLVVVMLALTRTYHSAHAETRSRQQ
jgi:hypothetical protein